MHILIALDQLLNTFLAGYADETVSSRAYRMDGKKRRWTIARTVIDGLFFWEPDHCRQAYLSEQQRRQLPPEFRAQP